MPQAARVGDTHACPAVQTVGSLIRSRIPHVGGPVVGPGATRVLIGGRPAATVGGTAICVGPADTIAGGSRTVMIGGHPAARLGDPTAHGGMITSGLPTVLIGD